MSNKKNQEKEAKRKSDFINFLLNCDLEQLYIASNRTMVNSARNYFSGHLKIQNSDPYSAYNSYFIAAEEAVKAFSLMTVLFQRQEGNTIKDSVLDNIYLSFKHHQPKVDTIKRIIESLLIFNGAAGNGEAKRKFGEKFDEMFTDNKIYKLKNDSIYVNIDTQKKAFVYPEDKIMKRDATFLKALCIEVNRFNRYLINTENVSRANKNLFVFPLEEEINKYHKTYVKKP